MTSPLVAVTAISRRIDVNLREPQPQATVHRRFGTLIGAAGGIAASVAPDADPEALLERVDAVIVNGGEDVGPESYGASPHPELRDVDRERDEFELALARLGSERGVKVLGVCRGMHVVNVALGGTLHQHLPELTDLVHERRDDFDRPTHPVKVAAGSMLADALDRAEEFDLEVNSVHHQAVDRLGEGLEPIAWAPDGVVEAIAGREGRVLAIQWHPEFLPPDYDPLFVPILRKLLGTDR